MVNKKTAFKISALSATAVALIHYASHELIPRIFPTLNETIFAGLAVFLAVFLLGFYGMTGWR